MGCQSLALVVALLIAAGSASAQEVGRIFHYDLRAQIKDAGDWRDITKGEPVLVTTEVRTDGAGAVSIPFSDKRFATHRARLDMSHSSHVKILSRRIGVRDELDHVNVELTEGDLLWMGAGEVAAGPATATPRGTMFMVSYRDGRATVTGVSGQTEVSGQVGSPVLLEAQTQTIVEWGKAPTPPVQLDDAEFNGRLGRFVFIGNGTAESQTIGHPLLANRVLRYEDRAPRLEPPTFPWDPIIEPPFPETGRPAFLGVDF